MRFGKGDGITLTSVALVQHQAVSQINQSFVQGYPFRDLYAGYLIIDPHIEEMNPVFTVMRG